MMGGAIQGGGLGGGGKDKHVKLKRVNTQT